MERGYNIYEANCARCHGKQGEGGIGPTLNRQDKLFAHLSEDYLRNILNVGGRYACGDPKSLMPVWSDTGHPPGPLNYRQIDELIAFIRATSDETYIARHPELLDPRIDPVSGKVVTFKGWRDPNYKPEPAATPYPACWKDEFAAPASGEPGRRPRAPGGLRGAWRVRGTWRLRGAWRECPARWFGGAGRVGRAGRFSGRRRDRDDHGVRHRLHDARGSDAGRDAVHPELR
ncbi:MAG: cytochrome c [Candidatus Limnocylindrales bacterium]